MLAQVHKGCRLFLDEKQNQSNWTGAYEGSYSIFALNMKYCPSTSQTVRERIANEREKYAYHLLFSCQVIPIFEDFAWDVYPNCVNSRCLSAALQDFYGVIE